MSPTDATGARRLLIAHRLTWLVIALAAIAAGVGLAMPGVYRETDRVIPLNRRQGLVTLFALAALMPALVAARRGSSRAILIWFGLPGYLAYTLRVLST
ncbi:MAG: hypothetical protein WCA12_08230 [Burkholderiales bacterium]